MKLILTLGTDTAALKKVEFKIASSTNLAGYSSNTTAPAVTGQGKEKDYSFDKDADLDAVAVTRTSSPDSADKGGKMEAGYTWAYFWCKDYGGLANVEAVVTTDDGMGGDKVTTYKLRVPLDEAENNGAGDGIADKWQTAMAERWKQQYGENPAQGTFAPGQDAELKDPDGKPNANRPRVDQAETGDAHTTLEEYRGYIFDGGGFNGTGAGGHAGGHIRLDPARKEILVEVDRTDVLTSLPGNGLTSQKLGRVLDNTAKVFSDDRGGAGIYMYYLIDDKALEIAKADINTNIKVATKLRETRNPKLQSDFMHLVFVDEGIKTPNRPNELALTVDRATTNALGQQLGWTPAQQLAARGTMVGTTDVDTVPDAAVASKDGLFAQSVAHELTHQLIDKQSGVFDQGEHTTHDEASIMAGQPNKKNTDFTKMKFTPEVEAEIHTRSGEWGTL